MSPTRRARSLRLPRWWSLAVWSSASRHCSCRRWSATHGPGAAGSSCATSWRSSSASSPCSPGRLVCASWSRSGSSSATRSASGARRHSVPRSRVQLAAPPPARGRPGLVAQRLVAGDPRHRAGRRRGWSRRSPAAPRHSRWGRRRRAGGRADRLRSGAPVPFRRSPAPASGGSRSPPGDTLIGLARQHLGDADRWPEKPSSTGNGPRRTADDSSKSAHVRVGWTLRPAAPTASSPVPSRPAVRLAAGDRDHRARRQRCGLRRRSDRRGWRAETTSAVAGYVQRGRRRQRRRGGGPGPDLRREQFDFPAVGTPPAPPRSSRRRPAPPRQARPRRRRPRRWRRRSRAVEAGRRAAPAVIRRRRPLRPRRRPTVDAPPPPVDER